ncbi:MAG TPA: serine/threonine-protein kinase [Candidatus Udaeobacter sp.]|nr:serine/threonine-protein kinase [Candidatus Udaeobacter sp.]
MASEPTAQTCPGCGTPVDTAGAEPLARIPCPNCGKKIRVERTFDHFVVVETLGVGGMGTVYKARDTQLDRFVALKLLRRDLGGEVDYNARLQQEARSAASLNHPNVIQVFDSGTDHGQFYVVMELVDRGSLDDLMTLQPRLSEGQVLETGIQVAKGLRAALRRGLIHRDVKPANILFADEHAAKIGDFGLASVATQRSDTGGILWGTPFYVAPERLSNEPEDFRSDIYSLGATLFHALAGKPPIEGDTNSSAVLRELKQRPLDLHTVAPDVSPRTAHVLQRMIAADPGQRFSSYDDLVAELERARRILEGGAARWQRWWWPRSFSHGFDALRKAARKPSPLIRVALPVGLIVAAIFFAVTRFFSPSWTDLTGRVASLLERGPWNRALTKYKEQVAQYHFGQAADAIRNVRLIGAYFKQAKEIAEKRARLLIDWKHTLIDDLNRTHFTGPLVDSSGRQYTGIASATDESLSMKLPYGIARVRWDQLPAKELLTISESFIKPGVSDAADRQWRCAIFASETGQIEAARDLAEAAARAKPEYREQIPQLLRDIAQAP